MIDFRYHLVSIVSIFLALAVGIVLGAGPLQGQIADTLSSEITQLRTDKQALRQQVNDLRQTETDHTAYESSVRNRVVSGLIAGRGVAIVELPGADADVVRQVAETVVAAGGTVSSTTRVLDKWVSTDPTTISATNELVNRLASTLRVQPGPSTSSGTIADRLLAAALAGSSNGAVGSDATRSALTELVAAKLIDVDATKVAQAQFVVLIGHPLAGATKEIQDQATAWVQLAGAFDAASTGAVLASSQTATADTTATVLIRVLRNDATVSKAVSTVDNAVGPMGQASVVLALVGQEAGTTGHYGSDQGATAPFAPLPTP